MSSREAGALERKRPDAASDRADDARAQPVERRGLGRIYRVFSRHYRKVLPMLLAAALSLVVGIGLALLVPWPLAWMIDHVIKGEPLPTWMQPLAPLIESEPRKALAVFAATFVAIKLLHAVVTFFDKYLAAAAAEYIAADIRERVFAHLQRLSLSFHRSAHSGDLIYRLTRDITEVRELLVAQPEALVRSSFTIVAFAGVMLWLNWRLALIAFSILPLLWAMTYWTQSRIRKAETTRKEKESGLALVVNENVRALALVQAYGQEAAERSLFDTQNQGSLQADVRVVRLSRRFKRASDLLVACATAGVLYIGGRAVLGAELTLGAFVVFYSYIDELYGPVDRFVTTILGLARHRVAGERIVDLIENDMVVSDRPDAIEATALRGHVEFRGVDFAYGDGPRVLHEVSFGIQPGETVALVGPSGAGKSTLISLLLRFFDPTSGEILVDGRNLRDYKLASLRAQIAILQQEAVLLPRSVRENIAFGRPDASDAEVVAAARSAQAHAFIEALPSGYDQVLKEGGADLSGGQRQRIHIARAILRDAPIVILDEPLRGLDAESEALVYTALTHLMEKRTALVIAHRLATIERADRILVLDSGGIVEQGTHAELMAASSRYRELYELQVAPPTAA